MSESEHDSEGMPMEPPVLKRQYKMTAESREARIRNLALGREKLKAKREKQQAKKKSRVVVHEDEQSDSDVSSDEEEYIIKKKSHNKPKHKGGSSLDALQSEIQNLKKMLKKKTVVNKTIVQMPSNDTQPKENPKADNIKRALFKMY